MEIIDDLLPSLKGLGIAAELKAIRDYLDKCQPDFTRFMAEYGIHCPSGCGSCCEHFVPDITRSEALLIAAYILCSKEKDALMDRLESGNGDGCPLFDLHDADHHCTIYPVRPLICRMFLSACSSDKNGVNRFSFCHGIDGNGIQLENLNRFQPMSYYGEKLRALEGNGSDAKLLPEAVSKAINRIGLEMMYSGYFSDDGGESNPA